MAYGEGGGRKGEVGNGEGGREARQRLKEEYSCKMLMTAI